jgi:hypothetical protein
LLAFYPYGPREEAVPGALRPRAKTLKPPQLAPAARPKLAPNPRSVSTHRLPAYGEQVGKASALFSDQARNELDDWI